ncbi:glycosyl transferase, partial [Bradyrhizobium sp. Arg68]|nr:glycosyl transferase [Bradyrhizobium ivorense]
MTVSSPMRIAFNSISRRQWAGGYNYQRNLFAALARFRPGEFAPVVFAGKQSDASELADLAAIPGVEIVRAEAFDGQPEL